ncbi:MAG: hypothetical protein ACUVYA_18425 [Planctomycetota bacterium]
MWKWTKRLMGAAAVAVVAGVAAFGTGFPSYLRSSGRMLGRAVHDAIPVEFEIQRARDLLSDLIPEMRANLRLVAAEEVEVANLEKEIEKQKEAIGAESDKLQRIREALRTELVSYEFSGRRYARAELVEELARRFEHLKTAELLLDGRQELLKNRRRSLEAALKKLEKTRVERVRLAAQIEALEGQFRLVQAQSAGSEFHFDDSKLARTQKVIADLRKRLETAQRVLAREAEFVEMIPVEEPVNEGEVVSRVDDYFSKKTHVAGRVE